MKIVEGNLISMADNGEFDVIIHGCNCFCVMGAGIAKTIKQKWPSSYDADLKTVRGDKNKLGTISKAIVETTSNTELIIVNAYTQYHWHGQGNKADYDAIRSCFKQVAIEFPSNRIGYPLIGAGLAGGNWSIISTIIDEELHNLEHVLVKYVSK